MSLWSRYPPERHHPANSERQNCLVRQVRNGLGKKGQRVWARTCRLLEAGGGWGRGTPKNSDKLIRERKNNLTLTAIRTIYSFNTIYDVVCVWAPG